MRWTVGGIWFSDFVLRATAITTGCDILVLHKGGGPPFLYSRTEERVQLVDSNGRVLMQQPEMDAEAESADGMAFICANVPEGLTFVPQLIHDAETIVLVFGRKHFWPALLERPVSSIMLCFSGLGCACV